MRKGMVGTLILLAGLFIGTQGVPVKAATQQIVCDINGSDREDDTKAIQKYLDIAKDNKETSLYLPKGTYYISKTLTIYSNTTLTLDSEAEIVRTDEQHIMIRSEQDYEVGGYGQFSNITIQGGKWNGNVKDSTVLCPLMFFDHGTNLTLQNFDISSCCSRHFVILAGIDTAKVSEVSFSDAVIYTGKDENNEYFISAGEVGPVDHELSFRTMEALHLDCISADGMSEASAFPLDNTVNKDIVVEKCTFDGLLSGVGSHYSAAADVRGSGLIIRNNTFKNMRFTCVDIYNQTGAQVYDNKAYTCGELVRSVNSTMTIRDNTISCDKKRLESNTELCGIKITDSSSATISGNAITGGTHGISLSNVKGTVSKNTVSGAAGNGITALDQSEVNFLENNITKAGISGIYVEKGKTSITGNKITSCENHGIAVYESPYTISKNTVSGIKTYGICVNNATGAIMDNEVDNVFQHAIYALEGGKTTISDNVIGKEKGVLGNGIYTNAVTGTIKGNTVSNTTLNGILIFDSHNTATEKTVVDGNAVNSPGGNGIRLEEAEYVDVKYNKIYSAAQPGIQVYHTKNSSINTNSVKDNVFEGIYVFESQSVWTVGNTVNCLFDQSSMKDDETEENTGNHNAIAYYDTTGASVKTNKIDGAVNGVLFNNAKGEILSNEVKNVSERGVWMLGKASATVKDNTISATGGHGIHFVDATGIITENTLSNIGQSAVFIYKGRYSTEKPGQVISNTISAPKEHGVRVEDSINVLVAGNEIAKAQKQSIHAYQSENLTITKNQLKDNNAEGLYIYQSKKVTLDGNTLNQTKATNGIAVYASTDVDVKANNTTGGTNGILLNASTGSISSNIVSDVTESGIWMVEKSKADVSDNTISNAKKHGIHMVGAYGNISANKISGIGENTIFVYGSQNTKSAPLKITKHNFVNPTGHGIRVENSEYVEVTANEISGAGKSSIHLFNDKNVVVESNQLKDNKAEGIYISAVDIATIQNNTLNQVNKNNGIAIYTGNKIDVKGNATSGGENGILMNASSGNLSGNTIKAVSGKGIWILEKSNATVVENAISKAGGIGIHVAGASGNINKNTFEEIGGNIIYIYGSENTKENPTKISNHKIAGSNGNGIRVEESKYVTVSENEIAKTALQSIQVVKSKNIIIENNQLSDLKAEAIYVFNCEEITAKGNKVSLKATDVLKADGEEVLGASEGVNAMAVYGTAGFSVNSNAIEGGNNGLVVNASKGTVAGNEIKNVTGRGMWILEKSSASIENNNINATGSHAIHMSDSMGAIKNNTIAQAIGKGIYLYGVKGSEGTPMVLSGNSVKEGKDRGIQVELSSLVSISENVVTDNMQQGIRILNASNAITIDGNTIERNKQHGLLVENCTNMQISNNIVLVNDKIDVSILGSTGSGKNNIISEKGFYVSDPTAFPVECKEKEPAVNVVTKFDDVSEKDWFVGAVQFAYDEGLMKGKKDNIFEPNGKLTRAQFATVLYNMEKTPAVDYNLVFSDVPDNLWYTKPILWAYYNGVSKGYGEKFGVNDNISREQLAQMLYAYAKTRNFDMTAEDGIISKFSDSNNVSGWATNAMNWAVTQGIMNGKGTGTNVKLDPLGSATRAECAAMMKNLLTKQK